MGLIGRASELTALTAGLDALARGDGRAMVVLGPRGAGKTTIAEVFAASARTGSVRVLWMAGRAMGGGAPGWPWPAVVRSLGGDAGLVDRLTAGGAGAPLFEDVAAVVAGAAERHPVVLVVDDADVLEDGAGALLVFVAEQLRFQPLVVLVTASDRRRVEPLCRAATVIPLPGLDPGAVRELLAANEVIVGDDGAAAVAQLTGGVPREVIVLARELASRRADGVDDIVRAVLGLASEAVRTDGRAAAEPLARRLIAARHVASPRTQGEIVLFVHRLGGPTSATADDRVALIDDALRALGDDDGSLSVRAQLHAALAGELYHGDVLRDGYDPAAEAARGWDLARASGDAPTQARCLRARHDIDWRPGTAAQRVALLDDIVTCLDGTALHEELAEAVLARFAAYLELGDTRADREFDRFLRVAERDPTPRLRHLVVSRRAMRALMTADLRNAEDLINAAAASARASGEPDGAVVALNQRWELHAERGDRSPLLPTLERFRAVSSHPAIVASLALARLDAGDEDGARAALAPFENVALDEIQPEYGRAWVLSMLGEAFIAVGARAAIRRTADALLPFAGTNIVVGAGVLYRGAVDHHLGVLLVATDEHAAGVAHLRAALEMHLRIGATGWAHRTEEALRVADTAGDNRAEGLMARDGDVWTLAFASKTVRAKDSKGLRDLAMLLANPGVEIRAATLAGARDDASADEILDERARDEIAARLRVLDADIARADERGDPASSARAVAERDALIDELRVTTGLAGRHRRLGDPSERARKAVSARLHDAIVRLERQHAELGRHLQATVSTGGSCRYAPHPAVRWVVRQNESGG